MSHSRVIPRDFFNESKLLKCLGRLSLLIHEGKVFWPIAFHDGDGEPFQIELDGENNALVCVNYPLYYRDEPVELRSIYNSKAAYPLVFSVGGVEDYVFDDGGSLSDEFVKAMNSLGGR